MFSYIFPTTANSPPQSYPINITPSEDRPLFTLYCNREKIRARAALARRHERGAKKNSRSRHRSSLAYVHRATIRYKNRVQVASDPTEEIKATDPARALKCDAIYWPSTDGMTIFCMSHDGGLWVTSRDGNLAQFFGTPVRLDAG